MKNSTLTAIQKISALSAVVLMITTSMSMAQTVQEPLPEIEQLPVPEVTGQKSSTLHGVYISNDGKTFGVSRTVEESDGIGGSEFNTSFDTGQVGSLDYLNTGALGRATAVSGDLTKVVIRGERYYDVFDISNDNEYTLVVNNTELSGISDDGDLASGTSHNLGSGCEPFEGAVSQPLIDSCLQATVQSGAFVWDVRGNSINSIDDVTFLDNNDRSQANGISGDGTVIVGNIPNIVFEDSVASPSNQVIGIPGGDNGTHAVFWTKAGEGYDRTEIPTFKDFFGLNAEQDERLPINIRLSSQANGASFDGSVIYGQIQQTESISELKSTLNNGDYVIRQSNNAFVWSDADGLQEIYSDRFRGGNTFANDISADGKVVVGRATENFSELDGLSSTMDIEETDGIAFRWTDEEGTQSLGTLDGDFASNATGVSADGSIIVGTSTGYAFGTCTATLCGLEVGSTLITQNETRAFIFRNVMLDLENTQDSIAEGTTAVLGMTNQYGAILDDASGSEVFLDWNMGSVSSGMAEPSKPMAVRVGGALVRDGDVGRSTVKSITGAFGVGHDLALGVSLVHGKFSSDMDGVSSENAAIGGGIYVRKQSTDKRGMTWKISMGQISGDVEVTRDSELADTEAGYGETDVSVRKASVEIGYGLDNGNWFLQPYARFQRMAVARDAYTETDDVSFPVAYDAYKQYRTIATFGATGTAAIAPDTYLTLGLGLEIDLADSDGTATGTSDAGGLSVNVGEVSNKTRLFTSFGVRKDFGSSTLAGGLGVSQSAYTDDLRTTLNLGFEKRF